jgi:hypothetical protein
MERPPSGGLSGETDSRELRLYAGFEAALAIGVRSNSVPVRGIRLNPMLDTAALACLKHSARAASAEKEAPRNGRSKATAKRVLVRSMSASLKEITPSVSGGRVRADRLPDYCRPGSDTLSGAAAAAMQGRRVCRVHLPRHQDGWPRNSADAADPRRRGDRISPPQALSNSFHLRRHVGKAAYPVGRVAAFENPNFVIRLRALRVPHSAEWFVTGNALQAYLCREHVLRRFACGLRRISDQATA